MTRRELMREVQKTLQPLCRWQILQLFIGVLLIGLGAHGWAPNTDVPYRLISGAIVHLYGVVFTAAAIAMIVRIRKIDYSKPIVQTRQRIVDLRLLYLRLSPLIGFPWWLMWIPTGVAAGIDQILHPNSLVPSLIVGVIGLFVSLWLYFRVQRPDQPRSIEWSTKFAGRSIQNALQLLDELKGANVR